MVNGRPKQGIFKELASQLQFKPRIIAKHWKTMAKKLATLLSNHPGEEEHAVIARNHHILFKPGHSDRRSGKHKYNREELTATVAAVPLKQRMNYRHLATKIGVPRTTVYYFLKPRPKRISRTIAAALEDNDETKILKKHSSALKPYLSEEVKQHRFLFCLAQVKEATVGRRTIPRFEDQYDRVHIDEKWFNMSKDGERYILTMDEELPVRRVQHKCYIEKVMFLCAQARPRWNVTTRTWWDGKIGMWPIVSFQRAQRSSVNRPAGARVWVNEGMGHEKHIEMLFDCVIPAILEKWPAGEMNELGFKIKIQQDNARGHAGPDSPEILERIKELEDNGIIRPGKISFYSQPPHSPDLNLCDLGLFAAVQSAYYQHSPRSSLEIIDMVQRTYQEYPPNKINRIWVTLMSIFNCIIENHGNNDYKIPHMNKEKMEREGTLPRELQLSQEAYHCIPVDNGSDDDISVDSDSDEEASTNSDYSSLSPEDLAYYKEVETEMLEAGTL
jgi:hypothetical protein